MNEGQTAFVQNFLPLVISDEQPLGSHGRTATTSLSPQRSAAFVGIGNLLHEELTPFLSSGGHHNWSIWPVIENRFERCVMFRQPMLHSAETFGHRALVRSIEQNFGSRIERKIFDLRLCPLRNGIIGADGDDDPPVVLDTIRQWTA